MILIEQHIVSETNEQRRFVDYCIGLFPQLMTKNAVKKAIKKEELFVNGSLATSGLFMKKGDIIDLIDNQKRLLKAFPLDVEIVFEDDYFVIVNKPSGLVVSGNMFRTLENAMVDKVLPSTQQDKNQHVKPVHRLDAATSGLLIMSKTATAHRSLAKLFENRQIQKVYHAIVSGEFADKKGSINHDIQGQYAETGFEVKKVVNSLRSEKLSLIELTPKTGRTHQLRIHCAAMGIHIVGDQLYGEEGKTMLHKGLFLVATSLIFKHPITDDLVVVEIDIPNKFGSLMEREERRWNRFKLDANKGN